MLVPRSGDLLQADAHALVNAVNTVGVMGKGLAAAFKKAFPDYFVDYRAACALGQLQVGGVRSFDRGLGQQPRWVVSLPTKKHWRQKSDLQDVAAGLDALSQWLTAQHVSSIAVPALGCGLGGLRWEDVEPLIHRAAAATPSVDWQVFPPRGRGPFVATHPSRKST